MLKCLLADRLRRHCNPVVLLHPLGRLGKRMFRAKINQYPLQGAGAAPRVHAGALAEGPQFFSAPAQAQQLFLNLNRTKRREPPYFFLMCLLLWGWSLRACARA